MTCNRIVPPVHPINRDTRHGARVVGVILFSLLAAVATAGAATLELQLDADNITDSPGTAVTVWSDTSGNHYDAWPTDGPLVMTETIGGSSHQVVHFNYNGSYGSGDAFDLDGSGGGSSVAYVPARGDYYTLFIVGAVDTDETTRGIMVSQDVGGWNNLDSVFGVGHLNMFMGGSGKIGLETNGPVSGTINGVSTAATYNDAEFHIFTGRIRGTNYEVGVDGLLKTATSTQSGFFGADGSAHVQIGTGGYWENRFFDGDIAELRIYSGNMGDGQFQTVGKQLADSYGLETTFVPEPSSLVLAVLGLLGLALYAWRRKR